MNEFTFLAPLWLWLLLLLPCWFIINGYHQKQTRLDLVAFRSTPLGKQRQYSHQVLMLLTLLALVLALAKPGWNPETKGGEGQGRDLVFLLDVSRSMLVDDARPNRLEVARQAIRNTINASENDRFGLVVFAGSTSIQSPLTNDKTFFNFLLDEVNSDSVAQGGTRIEDALFKVLDKMSEKNNKSSMDIILISDGEDLGSQPERALKKLNELGSRLIVIGLGKSEFGGRIPARDGKGWQVYQGKEIWSTMQTTKLRDLAKGAEQGMFIPVGTAVFDLAKIIEKLRLVWPTTEQNKGQVLTYHQGYPYLLFFALFVQIICWLRGRHIWLTTLVLLSFNSQAVDGESLTTHLKTEVVSAKPNNSLVPHIPASLTEVRNDTGVDIGADLSSTTDTEIEPVHQAELEADLEANTSIEQLIDTSAEALSKLTIEEQFSLAHSLHEEDPAVALDIFRYIAEETIQADVAILANYNLATCLILYAKSLEQQLDIPDDLLDQIHDGSANLEDFFDDEEYIDPEIYYIEAADVLRTLLLYDPSHVPSQQNLEWLMVRAQSKENNDQQQQAQQQAEESQQQQQDEQSDQQEESDQESEETSEEKSDQSKDSEQSQQSEVSALQLDALQLPPPQASAEEILQQAKERNLTERAPKSKQQTTVERDW